MTVRSPGYQSYFYNFNYTRCKNAGPGKAGSESIGSDQGEDAIAFANDVKIGTTVDMGQSGIVWSHRAPSDDTVKKGDNNYVCDNNSCRRE